MQPIKTLLLFFTVLWSTSYSFGQHLQIQHGPYLQELTTSGVTVVFETSQLSYAYVQVRATNSPNVKDYYQSAHGLKQANTQFFAVRIADLQAATSYQYRIIAKEMRSFQPYKVTFGDSIATPWYDFKTLDPNSKGGSFFVISDTHSNTKKLAKLLDNGDYQSCDAIFYVGDMMNYMSKGGEHPFTSFIDVSVDKFAKHKPFEFVRGNHETRGDMARIFPNFFPKSNNKIYGSQLVGDVMFIMLDSGEDKSDKHPVYAGITDYDAYRSEQAAWLAELVKTKAYKKAKYRIVLSHFPMILDEESKNEGTWTGWQDAIDKFLPILNKANVDLVVSGHTHRFDFYDKDTAGTPFPQLVQGAVCAARLEAKDGKIQVKVFDVNGAELLNKQL